MFEKKVVQRRAVDLDDPDPLDDVRKETKVEQTVGYGEKLAADIEAAGEAEGLDSASSRRVAGAFFRAAAECLERVAGGEPEEEPVAKVEVEEVSY